MRGKFIDLPLTAGPSFHQKRRVVVRSERELFRVFRDTPLEPTRLYSTFNNGNLIERPIYEFFFFFLRIHNSNLNIVIFRMIYLSTPCLPPPF